MNKNKVPKRRQIKKRVKKNSQFGANKTVVAAESVANLSVALPPQVEPSYPFPEAFNLANAATKVFEPTPISINDVQPNIHPLSECIDINSKFPPASTSLVASERNLRTSSLLKINEIPFPPANPYSDFWQKCGCFNCSCCPCSFASKSSLTWHIKLKHPEYVTPSLGRSFKPNIAIPYPSKPTREHLSFSCNFCKKSFKTIAYLRSHMIRHRIKYLCHLCLKTFANHEECNRHFETSHPSVHKRINSIDESGMKWSSDDEKSCEVIPKAASASFGSFACMICFRKVTSVKNLQQHFTRHLSKDVPEISPPDDGLQVSKFPLLQVLLGVDEETLDKCFKFPKSAATLLGVKKV